MSKKEKLTKEEKIEKAKKLTEELQSLKLKPNELDHVSGGRQIRVRHGDCKWDLLNIYR